MVRYLVVDTETGGIDPKNSSLLTAQFSVYDDKFKLMDELYLEMKHQDEVYLVNPKALSINKIDLVKHNEVALTYQEARAELSQFLYTWSNHSELKLTVLGHNPNFDLGFITEYLIPKSEWEQFVSYRVRDTAGVAGMLQDLGIIPLNVSLSLGSLAKHFNVQQLHAHTANDDVKVTVEVYQEMLYTLKKEVL